MKLSSQEYVDQYAQRAKGGLTQALRHDSRDKNRHAGGVPDTGQSGSAHTDAELDELEDVED
jgi:hypothetical protein